MARPSLLTPKVQRTICAALRDGHSFEVACEFAGIAPSTAYEWCARGEGRDPRRRSAARYRQFAEAVARAEGAVWRDEVRAEFAEPSERSKDGQAAMEREGAKEERNAGFPEFSESDKGFAETEHEGARRSTFGVVDELALSPNSTTFHQDARFAESPGTSRHVQAVDGFAEPQNWSETGDPPAKASESQLHAEFAEPVKSDTQRDRARARVKKNGDKGFSEFSESVARATRTADKEPRRAPMPWLSQRSRREGSILDMEF